MGIRNYFKGTCCLWLTVFLLFIVLAQSCNGADLTVSTGELVWAQSDGLRHEIYACSFTDGSWNDPVKITDNNADNLHPVVDIATDGTKWLFWSAVRPDGISIEYAVTSDGVWSEPIKIEMEQATAITPSILLEKKNRLWLVWAGNDGGNDEIYASRFINEQWSVPEVVNSVNEVPDVKPTIGYNDRGEIEVRWTGFRSSSSNGSSYVHLFSTYSTDGWAAEQQVEDEEQVAAEEPEVQLPSFVESDSQYFLKIL